MIKGVFELGVELVELIRVFGELFDLFQEDFVFD